MGLAGAGEIAKFVDQGGVLLTFGVSSFFPADFGIAGQVDAQRPQANFYAPGPYVQTEILQPTHPILFGYAGKNIPMRWADGPIFSVPGTPGQSGAETAAAVASAAPDVVDNGMIAK